MTESGLGTRRVFGPFDARIRGNQRDHNKTANTTNAISEKNLDMEELLSSLGIVVTNRRSHNTDLIASHSGSIFDSVIPATLMRPEPTI